MPASFLTTARNALRYMVGTDLVSDIDEGFQRLAEDVDTKMASYSQDTFAKRPAAGRPNALFRATDTGVLYHDTGTGWEQLNFVKGTVLGSVGAGEWKPGEARGISALTLPGVGFTPSLVLAQPIAGGNMYAFIYVEHVEVSGVGKVNVGLAADGSITGNGGGTVNLGFVAFP